MGSSVLRMLFYDLSLVKRLLLCSVISVVF